MHAIRAALGDEALASEGGELRLACSRLTADLWAFQSALAANALDQAVRLHAAPFLHGFSLPGAPEFDHWVELRRREVTDQYLNALERLAASADGCEDRVMAIARWRELTEASPYNSRFAIGLIEALCRSGDRGGAITAADEHERLLRRDLEAEPDDAFRTIAAGLRDGAPA